jgi:DnaK suppressor protein
MKKSLSQHEVEMYKQRLLHIRSATAAAVRWTEEHSLQALDNARTEVVDGATEETVMNLEIEGLAIQHALDRSTEEALERVQEGLYGVCATCGTDIARERLDLLPYAIECVQCAGRTDARRN